MTTERNREPRLPPRAESLLADWPAPSRGALAWEETSSSVMARVNETSIGSTPDDLLAAPLPEEPDEVGRVPDSGSGAASKPETSAAAEPSLADIARAALSASEAARKEVARDGLIAAELGRKNPPRDLTPTPNAAASAKVAGLQGRITRVSEPAVRPAVPEPPLPLAAVPAEPTAAPIREAAARSEMPAPLSREARRFSPAMVGSVLALAAAAALFVFTRSSGHSAPVLASAEAEQPGVVARAPQAPAPATSVAAVAPTETAAASAAEAAPSGMIALEELRPAAKSLALQSNSSAKAPLSFHVKKEVASGAGKIVLEEKSDAPEQNAPPPTARPSAPPQPAEPLIERPSTGMVQAAFGPVLMGARSCLAGQDEGPRATVTFDGRSGRVKSVVLEGPGAGSPAESCVRTALMGARVQPFSDPTFSASVTVRPL
jgi:hypothetical protein